MIKKKGTGKAVGKKSAKKRNAAKGKKELSAAEVRNDISRRVKSRAAGMAEAVMDEGDKGQLAPMKYLFEMANIFPPANDGSEASKDEDCLAKTLLDRLKLPHEAAPSHDQDEDEDTVVIPARAESAGENVAVSSDAAVVGGGEDQKLFTTEGTEEHRGR
jgi:hypothetical protein